jgi:enamine deaminase RidA (YjgF/YER057c/UK114 family)
MTIELRNATTLPEPAGFSHLSIAPAGRVVHLAGQIGSDENGELADGLSAQTTRALDNMVEALGASGGGPADLAKITIYIVDWTEARQPELFAGLAGASTRLPLVPITLIGVQSLFLDAALVEIEGVAVLADGPAA